ncbi:hypothetical protein Rhopal_001717-T1 [Rhodotorula paludigena]|uniref:Uncharacterized protein n=1 Tax=Rhodotorula paludigena TaxID=86838 RepID=A0AAV5GE12_9BASI|nr:hypothetical protein Rhopal_001717-T1 [Rhodotorula paludigena]
MGDILGKDLQRAIETLHIRAAQALEVDKALYRQAIAQGKGKEFEPKFDWIALDRNNLTVRIDLEAVVKLMDPLALFAPSDRTFKGRRDWSSVFSSHIAGNSYEAKNYGAADALLEQVVLGMALDEGNSSSSRMPTTSDDAKLFHLFSTAYITRADVTMPDVLAWRQITAQYVEVVTPVRQALFDAMNITNEEVVAAGAAAARACEVQASSADLPDVDNATDSPFASDSAEGVSAGPSSKTANEQEAEPAGSARSGLDLFKQPWASLQYLTRSDPLPLGESRASSPNPHISPSASSSLPAPPDLSFENAFVPFLTGFSSGVRKALDRLGGARVQLVAKAFLQAIFPLKARHFNLPAALGGWTSFLARAHAQRDTLNALYLDIQIGLEAVMIALLHLTAGHANVFVDVQVEHLLHTGSGGGVTKNAQIVVTELVKELHGSVYGIETFTTEGATIDMISLLRNGVAQAEGLGGKAPRWYEFAMAMQEGRCWDMEVCGRMLVYDPYQRQGNDSDGRKISVSVFDRRDPLNLHDGHHKDSAYSCLYDSFESLFHPGLATYGLYLYALIHLDHKPLCGKPYVSALPPPARATP